MRPERVRALTAVHAGAMLTKAAQDGHLGLPRFYFSLMERLGRACIGGEEPDWSAAAKLPG